MSRILVSKRTVVRSARTVERTNILSVVNRSVNTIVTSAKKIVNTVVTNVDGKS